MNRNEQALNELFSRLSDEAVRFIVELGSKFDLTFSGFEKLWKDRYGNKSYLKTNN